MKSFLIIQTAYIGDVILATPVIEKLHHFYPGSTIDFVLRKGNEALFENHPYINKVYIWNKKQSKYRNLFRISREIKRKKYDCVVNLQRFASSGYLAWRSKAVKKIGFDKNPFSFAYSLKVKHEVNTGKHETERNLELIRSITDDSLFRPRLYPSPAHDEKTKVYKQHPYLCLAPASVWFTKQLPAQKWIELLEKCNGYAVYLLGAAGDATLCEEILKKVNYNNAVNLCGKLSFLESASLMRDARMNYVNDSAPLHLASAVNAPVTSFFCSTVPLFGFGPLSDDSLVIETAEKLPCRPCGLHGYHTCPEKHFKCANGIVVPVPPTAK